jgi:membrane protein DedA with SNARE-associated domain
VTQADVDRAERFLAGRGAWAVPVGRMLPVIRAFTSIVAGLVRIPPARFGVLSLIGTVIYVTALTSIGYALGSAWTSISHGLAVAGYVIFAAAVVVIVGFVLYRLRQFRRESAQHQDRASGPGGDRDSGKPPVPRRPGKHRSDAEI